MLEEIKSRVSIRDLFETLGVVVKGKSAICPLHQDQRPSLKFKEDGLWRCFVCNVGGDIVNLVMEVRGLSFKESLNWINDTFSLGLTDKKPKRNYYLESLTESYKSIRNVLLQQFDTNCEKYYRLSWTPDWMKSKEDFNFELLYDDIMDDIEKQLRDLENARAKLRRNATQGHRVQRGLEKA